LKESEEKDPWGNLENRTKEEAPTQRGDRKTQRRGSKNKEGKGVPAHQSFRVSQRPGQTPRPEGRLLGGSFYWVGEDMGYQNARGRGGWRSQSQCRMQGKRF